jgi:hypothetical protein
MDYQSMVFYGKGGFGFNVKKLLRRDAGLRVGGVLS